MNMSINMHPVKARTGEYEVPQSKKLDHDTVVLYLGENAAILGSADAAMVQYLRDLRKATSALIRSIEAGKEGPL